MSTNEVYLTRVQVKAMWVNRKSSRYEFSRPSSPGFEGTWRFFFDAAGLEEILPRLLARLLYLTGADEGRVVSGKEQWDTTEASGVAHEHAVVISVEASEAAHCISDAVATLCADAIDIVPPEHNKSDGLIQVGAARRHLELPLGKMGEREYRLVLLPVRAATLERITSAEEHIKFAIFCAHNVARELISKQRIDRAGAMLDLAHGKVSMLEQELAEAQRITKTGTWYWNVRTGEDRWSAQAYKILGADPNTPPTYESFMECVHPEDRAMLRRKIDAAAALGAPMPVEYRSLHPDGAVHYIKTEGVAHRDAQGDLIYFGVMADVTEMKAAEERLRDLQSDLERVGRVATLGAFVGSIAHELNQPLASVLTSADAARRWIDRYPDDSEETRACIERIRADALRAANVVKHLRYLMTRTSSTRTQVDLSQAIQDVLTLLAVELNRQNVLVSTAIDEHLVVSGDPVQLQQVFLNLFANGIDAMSSVDDRARRLGIAGAAASDTSSVVLTVTDTGTGMEEETVRNMFVPFFSTKPGGMGMGLAICKSIVEAHAGELTVASEMDVGTTVVVTLPTTSSDRWLSESEVLR